MKNLFRLRTITTLVSFLFLLPVVSSAQATLLPDTVVQQKLREVKAYSDTISSQITRHVYRYYTLNSATRKERRLDRLKNRTKGVTIRKLRELRMRKLEKKLNAIHETNRIVEGVVEVLVMYENLNPDYSFTDLSDPSVKLIQSISEINLLEIVLRNVEDHAVNDTFPGLGMNSNMKAKLINAVSLQMNVLARKNFAWYNYATDKKQPFCALNINTSNDLFTPSGLGEEINLVHPNTNANIVQANDDRDYTGGVMISVATNFLKIRRQRPVKSYQELFWGGDFYTPYFRDRNIFGTPSSYNKLDRPFASFQYFGYSTHCLSRNNGFRWDINTSFGKIGGKRGQLLQSVLHQDISYSPRPMGWDAQIANGGRFGFSVQYKPEWIIRPLSSAQVSAASTRRGWYTSLTGDVMVGSYMTYGSAGLQFSNRNFVSCNTDYAQLRNNHTIVRGPHQHLPYIMWDFRINYRYVKHNAMLEGYGVFKTTEDTAVSRDALTPYSVYYLSPDKVKRGVCTADLTISKQARYFTFFYRLSVISPETTFGLIGIVNKDTQVPYDLTNRWHHWATLGVCFRMD